MTTLPSAALEQIEEALRLVGQCQLYGPADRTREAVKAALSLLAAAREPVTPKMGPNHKDGCTGADWRYSGEGYNRVRVCSCGAEDHAPGGGLYGRVLEAARLAKAPPPKAPAEVAQYFRPCPDPLTLRPDAHLPMPYGDEAPAGPDRERALTVAREFLNTLDRGNLPTIISESATYPLADLLLSFAAPGPREDVERMRKLTPERIKQIVDGCELSIKTTPRGFRSTFTIEADELLEMLAALGAEVATGRAALRGEAAS